MIETEFNYHGISYDERMAIFQLFHDDEDLETEVAHCFFGAVTEGCLQ